MSLEELIQAANELDETELDRLLQQIMTLRAHRKAHTRPAKEAELLDRINQEIPPDLRVEYQDLRVQIQAELTIQEAAELLNVSHPYLMRKIEVGDIPHRREGDDRRIDFEDLMAYKQQVDATSSQSLNEMVALSEEMGLYV